MKVNTELCVDLKTILLDDCIAKQGKVYQGMLKHDKEYHYTFREIQPSAAYKRNPHVYMGKYITITRRDDGSLRPNFKPIKDWKDFSATTYARGVANELLWAFESLLEKEAPKE